MFSNVGRRRYQSLYHASSRWMDIVVLLFADDMFTRLFSDSWNNRRQAYRKFRTEWIGRTRSLYKNLTLTVSKVLLHIFFHQEQYSIQKILNRLQMSQCRINRNSLSTKHKIKCSALRGFYFGSIEDATATGLVAFSAAAIIRKARHRRKGDLPFLLGLRDIKCITSMICIRSPGLNFNTAQKSHSLGCISEVINYSRNSAWLMR